MVATCERVASVCKEIDCGLLFALCRDEQAINAIAARYSCDADLLRSVCLEGVPARPVSGPGTELKKLLARVGIVATPDCSCVSKAAEMDRQGVEWCEANLDTIVGWLREQAHSRGLPFVDLAGRMLVRRAIRNARRNA
jgi:hypothetical protein